MSKRLVAIEGKNIDEVWFQTLTSLCENGRFFRITSGSHAGDFRLEFDKLTGIIERVFWKNSAGTDWLPVAPTVPDGCPAPTDEESIVKYFNNDLMNSDLHVYDDKGNDIGHLHYKYSTFIVGGEYRLPMSDMVMQVPNQMDWGIKHYMKHGHGNNHVCFMVGYPESNLAYDEPYDKSKETERNTSPCLRVIDTKIITDDDGVERLNFEVYFRSWDLYGGLPENLAGLGMLQQYMAYSLEVEPGVMGFTSIKAHVYGSRIKALAMRAGAVDLEERFQQVLKDHGVNYDEIPDVEC